jgi:hypothetical protein
VGPEEIAGFPGGWRSFVNLNTPQELVQVWAPMEVRGMQCLYRGLQGGEQPPPGVTYHVVLEER